MRDNAGVPRAGQRQPDQVGDGPLVLRYQDRLYGMRLLFVWYFYPTLHLFPKTIKEGAAARRSPALFTKFLRFSPLTPPMNVLQY